VSDTPRVSDPIPLEEATAVERPGTWNEQHQLYEGGGTWTWADPILSGASNAHEWQSFPYWDPKLGHADNRTVRNVIENLYRCGYALVKVLPEAADQ
jgi:hypothetical protein